MQYLLALMGFPAVQVGERCIYIYMYIYIYIYIYIGLHTAKGEAVRYHNRYRRNDTVFYRYCYRYLNYAKYTLSVVPDINLKRICCLSSISITTCDQM